MRIDDFELYNAREVTSIRWACSKLKAQCAFNASEGASALRPRERRNTQPSRNSKQRMSFAQISCAHVFVACKVQWTLHLSGSALYSSRLLVAVRLIWHVKSTGLYAWAKSRFEGAWNALCNFKLSQSAHASPVATLLFYCSYRNTSNLLNI